jgi:phage-related protein
MANPVFTYPVSFASQMDMSPAILEAKFGDGYRQRAGNGINTMLEVWSIQANALKDATEAAPMEAFLRAQAGVTAFQWATPFGRTALFVCKKWRRVQTSFGMSNISGTFEEVPA